MFNVLNFFGKTDVVSCYRFLLFLKIYFPLILNMGVPPTGKYPWLLQKKWEPKLFKYRLLGPFINELQNPLAISKKKML